VGFGVLNDNWIKGLISFVKYMSRSQTNTALMCLFHKSLDVNLRCNWNQMITQRYQTSEDAHSKDSTTSQLWKTQWTRMKLIITWSNINGLLVIKKKDDQILLILYDFSMEET
jgi:hypothetical protein